MCWIANPDNTGKYREEIPFLKLQTFMRKLTDLILINSWYFDFERMEAHRDPKWKHYETGFHNHRRLEVIFNGEIRRAESGAVHGFPFFNAPEDGFNLVIQRAYLDYIAERDLL